MVWVMRVWSNNEHVVDHHHSALSPRRGWQPRIATLLHCVPPPTGARAHARFFADSRTRLMYRLDKIRSLFLLDNVRIFGSRRTTAGSKPFRVFLRFVYYLRTHFVIHARPLLYVLYAFAFCYMRPPASFIITTYFFIHIDQLYTFLTRLASALLFILAGNKCRDSHHEPAVSTNNNIVTLKSIVV